MIKRHAGAMAGAMALAASAALAAAPDPVAAPQADQTITIPFAPVIGKPMHLRAETRAVRSVGGTDTVLRDIKSEETLVFTDRDKDGYTLRWTVTAAADSASSDRRGLTDALLAATVGKPLVLKTDVRGLPVSVENLGEMRSLLSSAIDAMIATADAPTSGAPDPARVEQRKALEAAAGVYRTMTDEVLAASLLEEPRSLFGFGGATLDRTHPLTERAKGVAPVLNAPVEFQKTVTVREAGPSGVTLAIRNEPDAALLSAAASAYIDKLAAEVAPEKQATMKAAMEALRNLAVTDDTTLNLDGVTGLPRHRDQTRRLTVPGAVQLETASEDVEN